MIRIGIIMGSTRLGRKAEVVAKWAYEIARKRKDAEFELVDIADFNLPLLRSRCRQYSATTAMITPEYGRRRLLHLTGTSLSRPSTTMQRRMRSRTPSSSFITNGSIRQPASSVTAVCQVLALSRICDSSWVRFKSPLCAL